MFLTFMNPDLMFITGNDSCIVIWNLSSGEMLQEICAPSAGFISCLVWIKLANRDEDSLVFGMSDGNIHLYQCTNEHPVFCFLSITLAHAGAVESLEWDPHHHQLASIDNGEVHVWKASPDQSMYYLFVFPSFFPQSSTLTHVESFVLLPSKAEKQLYVARLCISWMMDPVF